MNTHANTTPTFSQNGQPSRVETTTGSIEPVLTLAEIAEHLGVSVQALYDLRNKGRGPRGFKVGRCLHFRVSEVDAWLRQLESEDSNPAAAPRPSAPSRSVPTLRAVPAPATLDSTAPTAPAEDEPRQELAGDQWALLLDLPYPDDGRGSRRRS